MIQQLGQKAPTKPEPLLGIQFESRTSWAALCLQRGAVFALACIEGSGFGRLDVGKGSLFVYLCTLDIYTPSELENYEHCGAEVQTQHNQSQLGVT